MPSVGVFHDQDEVCHVGRGLGLFCLLEDTRAVGQSQAAVVIIVRAAREPVQNPPEKLGPVEIIRQLLGVCQWDTGGM